MNLVLLLHVLSMACLLGLLIPEIVIRIQIRRSESTLAQIALARLGVILSLISGYLLLMVAITGIWRTLEVGYPWFSFVTIWWLAFKQVAGIFLAGWVLFGLPRVHRLLSAFCDTTSDEQISDLLKRCRSAIYWHHTTIGLAWLLAVLGVIKPLFLR